MERYGHYCPSLAKVCVQPDNSIPLQVQSLKALCYADWAAVDPLDYLTPFMEVIRSPETSGPVTGVALTAVARFLDAYIIGAY